ncbi:GNAT family N-acetyltransferase [Cellulomonas denverensis]|uniref:N-acetyltransferase n=1 Tax=Cellulomonas denverensis TaxID=264297 RepID=A0A7X6QYW6_9CELL|nr:GNAT family N-acetyltransferase [Cellulomonas denverensis]NKY22599.1 N-acetyltransferase [Cellulomonas denverensis]GIG24756.1 N-acetyltransferase [Cellulomonas denverensis]
MQIRSITSADAAAVRDIFAAGIASGNATFEVAPPAWTDWDAGHHPELRYLAVDDDDTALGWVSGTAVSARRVYAGVQELGLYVAEHARGRGVGTALLRSAVERAPGLGLWTLQSTIFPENTGSLTVHRRLGFREVGRRERIALMTTGPSAGQWRDTVLLEKRLG